MTELGELLEVCTLEPTGEHTWRGSSIEFAGGSVVFGGQLLAQSIIAGASVDPTKEVKSIHTVFARGASIDAPLEFEVDEMQSGRSFASASVTVRQGDRLCTRSLVLLHAPDPDLIHHQTEPPADRSPEDAVASDHASRVLGGAYGRRRGHRRSGRGRAGRA